jgi:hypothetical protein
MYPDLVVSIVYQPALMLLSEYVPVLLVLSVFAIVPLVTFNPLLALRETPSIRDLSDAFLIVPEIVPEVQLSESIFKVETTSVWLSVASVADWVSSR